MNARQRFLAAMRFEPADRPFRWETLGMWPETLDRWYAEGLDPKLKQPREGDVGAIAYDEYQRVSVYGFDLDHTVPPNVSLQNFRTYIQRVRALVDVSVSGDKRVYK